MPRSFCSYAFWAVLVSVCAGGGVLAYIYSGVYDISAVRQHTPPIYWALTTARRQSIRAHSVGEAVPSDLADADVVSAGLTLFERHCTQCHGAPGIAPNDFALGMMPAPPNFAQMGREMSAPELHWAITNGIKLTGMPAWKNRLTERERWAIVAFLNNSSALAPARYRELRSRLAASSAEPGPRDTEAAWAPEGAAQRGRTTIQQYACATCHVIPGIRGSDTQVGPPLDGIATRVYLAGILTNTPGNMIEWLRHPQQIKPLSAMPNLGVTERDARDIAAYLYLLR